MKLRNSVFTQKDINKEAVDTVLRIENILFSLNERSKLERIAVFSSEDLLFSFDKDSIIEEDFRQIADFFKEAGLLEDWQFQGILEQGDDKLTHFEKHIAIKNASTIETTMKQMAFGGFEFENFDFRNKEDERALDYIANYGGLPNYEIADIEQRNQCIESICANLITDLGIDANTEIQQFLLNDALSDTSNSSFKIVFWIKGNTIFVVKNDSIL